MTEFSFEKIFRNNLFFNDNEPLIVNLKSFLRLGPHNYRPQPQHRQLQRLQSQHQLQHRP